MGIAVSLMGIASYLALVDIPNYEFSFDRAKVSSMTAVAYSAVSVCVIAVCIRAKTSLWKIGLMVYAIVGLGLALQIWYRHIIQFQLWSIKPI